MMIILRSSIYIKNCTIEIPCFAQLKSYLRIEHLEQRDPNSVTRSTRRYKKRKPQRATIASLGGALGPDYLFLFDKECPARLLVMEVLATWSRGLIR